MHGKKKPASRMKTNSDYHVGEFLFRFYRKRTASFLANIYKAGITGSSKDIHRARLDVKKILAILDLLRIVRAKKEKDPGYERLFTKLYKASGRIREIQVNLFLLTGPEFTGYDLTLFKLNLLLKERERTREFLEVIRKFNEQKLTRVEKRIKKEVYKITPGTLQKKTNRYISIKTALILYLLENDVIEKNVHEVRQHVKELSTVLTLVSMIKSSGKLERIIAGLNKSEMMIGDWHDRVVLKEAIERFLNENTVVPEEELKALNQLKVALTNQKQKLVLDFMPEVRVIVASILPENT